MGASGTNHYTFTGDGLSFRGIVGDDDDYKMTVEQRSSEFELPALLNMGLAYDINFLNNHRLTGAGAFTSNSFQKDQYRIGGEYSFRDMLMLRLGYTYEEGIRTPDTSFNSGLIFSGFRFSESILFNLTFKLFDKPP